MKRLLLLGLCLPALLLAGPAGAAPAPVVLMTDVAGDANGAETAYGLAGRDRAAGPLSLGAADLRELTASVQDGVLELRLRLQAAPSADYGYFVNARDETGCRVYVVVPPDAWDDGPFVRRVCGPNAERIEDGTVPVAVDGTSLVLRLPVDRLPRGLRGRTVRLLDVESFSTATVAGVNYGLTDWDVGRPTGAVLRLR